MYVDVLTKLSRATEVQGSGHKKSFHIHSSCHWVLDRYIILFFRDSENI